MHLNVEEMKKIVREVGSKQTDAGLKTLCLDSIIDSFQTFMETGIGFAYGQPGGFLLAVHNADVFNGRRKAFEVLFLVDHTHPDTAEKLLEEFESGAKADRCETTVVGAHAGFAGWKKVERYYRMKGYSFLSESMQKIL